jgi:hypothetical protein
MSVDTPEPSPADGATELAPSTWELTVSSPIGKQHAILDFSRDPATGALTGEARGNAETVPLRDVVQDGAQVRWDQSVTRPMKLNLHFDVTVNGDTLTGTAKAGRLPASAVTGVRAAARAG